MLQDYNGDLFSNSIFIGCSSLVGSLICYFIIDRFPRKVFVVVASAIAAGISLLIMFNPTQGANSVSILETAGLSLYRLAGTIIYAYFYMMQMEVFPTQICTIALQFTSLGYVVGFAVVPLIQGLFQTLAMSIVVSFLIISVLNGALTLCML